VGLVGPAGPAGPATASSGIKQVFILEEKNIDPPHYWKVYSELATYTSTEVGEKALLWGYANCYVAPGTQICGYPSVDGYAVAGSTSVNCVTYTGSASGFINISAPGLHRFSVADEEATFGMSLQRYTTPSAPSTQPASCTTKIMVEVVH
jgi:hypothetical protein